MVSSEVEGRLQSELARAPLRLAVLFGSQATGRTHAASDVDIAVLPLDEAWSLRDELALQGLLSSVVRAEVDLVRLDRADLLVCREVAQKGRPLFEARPGEWARFAANAMLDYLDLEPLLLDGQQRYLRRIASRAP